MPYDQRGPGFPRMFDGRVNIGALEKGAFVNFEKLTAGDAAAGDFFGIHVAISGDTMVVGASGDDDETGPNRINFIGSAYVFVRSGTTWTQQAKLTASDGAAGDFFGRGVAVSGNTIVVGALAACPPVHSSVI